MFSLYTLANDENQTYDLISLTPKFQHLLQMAFEHYEDCHQVFFDMQLTPRAIWKMRLQQVKNLPGLQGIHAMKRLTSDMAKEHKKFQYQQWRQTNAQSLTPEFFTRLQSTVRTPYMTAQLNELETRWQFHGNFAHFGNQTLLRAMKQLNYIEEFIQLAVEELEIEFRRKNWFREEIPESWYQGYKTYLKETLAKIETEKHRITHSMYERLRIAAQEQDLTSCDVLMHIINRLKDLHVVKQTFAADVKRERSLTPDLFKQYHEIIFAYGNHETKRRTLQLPWFQSTDPQTDTILFAFNGQHELKKQIAKQFNVDVEIPVSTKWPKWLFKGTAIRYQFFEESYTWASFCIASQRLDKCYENDFDQEGLEKLCFELCSVNEGMSAFEEKLKKSEVELKNPIRKFITKRTQQFLENVNSKLQAIKSKERQKFIRFLRKLEQSIKHDLLEPNERLELTLQHLKALELSMSPEIKAAFVTIELAIKQAKEWQQLRNKTLSRFDEADAILSPLRRQTRLEPAEETEISAAIDYYHALPARDDVVTTVIAEFDKICLNAKKQLLVQESHLQDSNQDTIKYYQREYQYLTNLGHILKAVGKQKERELVDNTVDEVLCHYLQSWARNGNKGHISIKQLYTQAKIQAAFIETLGDDDARRLINRSEMLRAEGRFEELGQLTMTHLKKYERKIVERYLAKQFKQCEETMFQYIVSKQRQELTAAQIQHFSKLASQMADARISDVTEFTSLTATDRAFLGLGAGRLEQWFNNRKLFIITINIIAGLRIAASQLPYLTNAEQRNQCVLQLQKQLEQQCKYYSDNQIQHIIKQSFFAQPFKETDAKTEMAPLRTTPGVH